MSMEPPTDWPQVIRDKYEPIRILGQGGFASVILAKCKTSSSSVPNSNEINSNINNDEFVAIKVAGNAKCGVTKQERLYGHREIDILRAMKPHPNIMECVDYAEPSPHTAMILVLSYSPGPTVEALLKHGGALSTLFGRVVIAQLVDALTYLHSHAVVHRDVKPDNIIVTGAAATQAEIWDNPAANQDDDGNSPEALSRPDWEALRTKWHVTLVDFGFARALTKEDVHQPSPELHRENMDASFHQSNFGAPSLHGDADNKSGGISQSSGAQSSLNRSLSGSLHSSRHQRNRVSTMLHRRMSALGTAQFAAPEIKQKVVKKSTSLEQDLSTSKNADDITRTISPFVADYGLLVDAYSLGCTIRYMMTGCQPHQSVAEAIADQNNIVNVLCGLICGGRRNQAQDELRTPRYRYVKELPGEVQRLIETLTVHDPTQRASVRAARRYPWINDVLPTEEQSLVQKTFRTTDIQYLDFTKAKEDHIKHTPTTCTV